LPHVKLRQGLLQTLDYYSKNRSAYWDEAQ
jgi:hypothetical protein